MLIEYSLCDTSVFQCYKAKKKKKKKVAKHSPGVLYPGSYNDIRTVASSVSPAIEESMKVKFQLPTKDI